MTSLFKNVYLIHRVDKCVFLFLSQGSSTTPLTSLAHKIFVIGPSSLDLAYFKSRLLSNLSQIRKKNVTRKNVRVKISIFMFRVNYFRRFKNCEKHSTFSEDNLSFLTRVVYHNSILHFRNGQDIVSMDIDFIQILFGSFPLKYP